MARRGWVCTLTIYLKPGSYQVTCPLDNHAAMDMQVDLLVTG